jgi:hypothetical protein
MKLNLSIYGKYTDENRRGKIFGNKTDDTSREWIIFPNDELNNLYLSTNIVKMIKYKEV